MVAIVTRELGAAPKGSPLSNSEVDTNFINLDEGKSEKYTVIKNMTGGTITPGTVVYITGSTGANVTVALASASSEATSSKTFAIVVDTILNNETGRAVRDQVITGLNTAAYTEGSAIWLGTTAGSITNVKPTPPDHTVFLGYVVRSHASAGAILVKILNGYEVEELHNVLFTGLTSGDVLEYDAVTSLWKNGSPTSTNTANRLVKRDAGGNFSAGTITAALSGNASTATTLQTARTINGTSFNGSSNITTSSWGTSRTVTIGNTGKSVDGSLNVSWTLSEIGAVAASTLGQANGVATLGSDGKVPSAQLPSFVDDVLEYANLGSFPVTGETAKIYVALDTNKTYRWSGSAYVYITSGAVDSVNGMTGVVTVSTITGNAGSATALQTARNINGTPFNGSADITTTSWGASRTITIGNTGKAVNGSGNVSWSLAELGALALTGGTVTGPIEISTGATNGNYNEGLRLTAANNGWAGVTFGSTGLSGTPTSGWFAAKNPTNQFIISPGTSDATVGLQLNSGGDALWRNSIMLTASNYNSYSPTLTGENASGTWGISISGNAASASTATNVDGGTARISTIRGTDQMIENNYGAYLHIGGWGIGRTDSAAVLVNTAYMADILAYSRTINGTSFNGSANIDVTEWVHSGRDFPSGTLITTNINYAVTNGDPFVLEIRGNSYGNIIPLDLLYQGYIYSDTIINHGGISNGLNITGLVAINNGGNLCFWFPSQGYWNGYNVKVYVPYDGRAVNRVTSITGVAKPTTAKQVELSSQIRQSLHSSNFGSYALPLSGGTLTGVTNYTGDNYSRFGPNSSWGAYLRVGGNGRVSTTDATVATTNGNLHLDSANGSNIYLNYYAGGTVYGPGGVTMLHSGNWSSYVSSGISTINYNNDSNSTYQMLWGSGNAIYGTGGIYCNPATDIMYASQFQATSDERLKTNWRELGEDFVRQLATVKHGVYDRLDIDLTQVGVSAQSLQRVLGESVSIGQDGMLSVNYGNAALVSSIQLAIKFVKLEDELSQIKEKLGLK